MQVHWSEGSLEDLMEIHGHIARDRPEAAEQVVTKLFQSASRLEHFPNSGRENKRTHTREIAVPGLPYLIDYDLETDKVIILRVRHGARSFPS